MIKEELYYLPASELLKYIKAEKDRLIKEKIIKKSKPLPIITEVEKPYELPKGWEWVRLGEVGITQTGTTPSTKNQEYFNGKIPFIKPADIFPTGINYYNDSLTEFGANVGRTTPENSVLMVCIGGSIGKTYYTDRMVSFNQQINAIECYSPIYFKYVYYCLISGYFYEQVRLKSTGTATPIINKSIWDNILIPLPPLYIQDQIVQKLDQISETKTSLLSYAESQLNYTKKMREALLQEAIRGELVPQDENDEPASVLLGKIKSEKERLIKEKAIKKSKELPPITEEERPYELPEGWEWVRLGNLVSKVGSGSTPKGGSKVYQEDGIKFIRSQNVYNDALRLDEVAFISEEIHEKMKGSQVLPNDLLLNITGGSIGRCSLVPQDFDTANVNQHVSIIRFIKGIDIRYFHKVLISRYIQNLIMDVQVGMSREGLSKEKIELFPVPLPPLAEQERIVAKLDKLMPNCDQLEAKAEEMKNYTSKLFEASLKEAFMPE